MRVLVCACVRVCISIYLHSFMRLLPAGAIFVEVLLHVAAAGRRIYDGVGARVNVNNTSTLTRKMNID